MQLFAALLLLTVAAAESSTYRQQPLPRQLSSDAPNGIDREQNEPAVSRKSPYKPHHPAGVTENIPVNYQAFLSSTGVARYTNGIGTAPRNTQCALPFTAEGRLFTDCATENLGEENPFNSDGARVRGPVGQGTGAEVGHGWCSTDPEFAGRWGGCMHPGYQPDYLKGRDADPTLHTDAYRTDNQGDSFYATPRTQYNFLEQCILDVRPRSSERQGGEAVTIVGKGFVAKKLSAEFHVGSLSKSSAVIFVSSKEMHTTVPAFLEVTATTIGDIRIKADNRYLHFCNDVATSVNYRHIPAFTIEGVQQQLFATDIKNDMVWQVDSTLGTYSELVESRSGGLKQPHGVEVGPDGALYVASGGTNQILRYELPSGQFRGVWATVPGEPRGIRWRQHELYVVSHYENRVFRYKHHNSSWNPRAHEYGRHASTNGHPFTPDMSQFVSGSAIDQNQRGFHRDERLDHPNDLRFHSIDGELKLFVSSAHSGRIMQFNGITGAYERIYTDTKVNLASGFAFAHRSWNYDLFVTSPYAGTAFVRFDGVTGKMKQRSKDINLRKPKGMVILGDTIFVTDRYNIQKFDIDSGTILEDAISIQTASLNFITMNMKCGADYASSGVDGDSSVKGHPQEVATPYDKTEYKTKIPVRQGKDAWTTNQEMTRRELEKKEGASRYWDGWDRHEGNRHDFNLHNYNMDDSIVPGTIPGEFSHLTSLSPPSDSMDAHLTPSQRASSLDGDSNGFGFDSL